MESFLLFCFFFNFFVRIALLHFWAQLYSPSVSLSIFGEFDFPVPLVVLLIHFSDVVPEPPVVGRLQYLLLELCVFCELESNGYGLLLFHAFKKEYFWVLLALAQNVFPERYFIMSAIQ